MTPKYKFVYPRDLKIGDQVLIDGHVRAITRMNTNRIRVTVYYHVQRGTENKERGHTYWVEVGEIRARKVVSP